MVENKSILYELYVFSEWKPEPEYQQKADNLIPENIASIWRWVKFFGPQKSLIDSVTAHKNRQQKWHIGLGEEGKVIAVLTDNILEIRTKRSDYATIAARTTVSRDAYPQWRRVVWSPDCVFVAVAYGNGVVSFFDLTAANLFSIPTDCSRPGGMECTDNTHAVVNIIFMPLRVKDLKWNWEVLIITFDGKVRGYLISQTEGFKLHHSFSFAGGVGAVAYSVKQGQLYVAGLPRFNKKDPSNPQSVGLSAWRIVNDEPFYKLSVVSDQLEAVYAQSNFYLPFVTTKNTNVIVEMELSPDHSKLVCVHSDGDVSVWRLPLMKMLHNFPLGSQPQCDMANPLYEAKELCYHPVDVKWWCDQSVIVGRASGSVSVCPISTLSNVLGASPQFVRGSPRISFATRGAFVLLECEQLPNATAKRETNDEIAKEDTESESTFSMMMVEMLKSILYNITDIETFQPKPKKITIVSRVYRLLGVKSTTPEELFNRKIENGNYEAALALSDKYNLDSDMVYQQQWRKTPVSTNAIRDYLSKVSKKIWAVHQCVDRLPESLSAAKELLNFGLQLTNQEILNEANKDREIPILSHDDIKLEDLNSHSSELLRCRHVMLFYSQRLTLYEEIISKEKSVYVKSEYDRLRSNNLVVSAIELAKEGRINALSCLWPHMSSMDARLSVLDSIPETISPLEYKHLLPYKFIEKGDVLVRGSEKGDWCRNEKFRSIWISNWSEELPQETKAQLVDIAQWYKKRAKQIVDNSGLINHALILVNLAIQQSIDGLDDLLYCLLSMDSLVYDLGMEDVKLADVQEYTVLETAVKLMSKSTDDQIPLHIKDILIPYLKRSQKLTRKPWIEDFMEFMEHMSIEELKYLTMVIMNMDIYGFDVLTRADLLKRCLFAHEGYSEVDRLEVLLRVVELTLTQIGEMSLVIVRNLLLSALVLWERQVAVTIATLKDATESNHTAIRIMKLMAHSKREFEFGKLDQTHWSHLLEDILKVHSLLFPELNINQCYEVYASSILSSGELESIPLCVSVLTVERIDNPRYVPYEQSVALVLSAAREYFNSASSLNDPMLDMAKECLKLIKEENPVIKEEKDLLDALPILHGFKLNLIPVQVRLCPNRMKLIEACVRNSQDSYRNSHKLLHLAKLLRIGGDDEHMREGMVLEQLCKSSLSSPHCFPLALRLKELRHSPAHQLMAQVAQEKTNLDYETRSSLYSAAITFCPVDSLEEMITKRYELRVQHYLNKVSEVPDPPILDDVDKKEIDNYKAASGERVVQFKQKASKEYLRSKWIMDANKLKEKNIAPSMYCQEFYRTLYPDSKPSPVDYSYSTFSLPFLADEDNIGQMLSIVLYGQVVIRRVAQFFVEPDVAVALSHEYLHRDSAFSSACLLRAYNASTIDSFISLHEGISAVALLLYSQLIKAQVDELSDCVYLANPVQLAQKTLENETKPPNIELILLCLKKLSTMVDIGQLMKLGFKVDGDRFNSDLEHRKEILMDVACSKSKENLDFACTLAKKYDVDEIELYVNYIKTKLDDLKAILSDVPLQDIIANEDKKSRFHELMFRNVWPDLPGERHECLINYFSLLKDVKATFRGLTSQEHIKLLKKVKAASKDMNYKILLALKPEDDFVSHTISVARPETIGLIVKLLRTLPSAIALEKPVNVIFVLWLTKYFFSSTAAYANNKKWMQQYRECNSFFNKLTAEDLQTFIHNICFTTEAIQRVPSNTRMMILMQAGDYCKQEQDNRAQWNKGETTWSQLSDQFFSLVEFLKSYQSSVVQQMIQMYSDESNDDVWVELEQTKGELDKVRLSLSKILMEKCLTRTQFLSLIEALNVNMEIELIFNGVARTIMNAQDLEKLLKRVVDYSKDGQDFSETFLENISKLTTDYNIPLNKQAGLLSMTNKSKIKDGGDMAAISKYSIELIKCGWSDEEFVSSVTEESLTTADGRSDTFKNLLQTANSWQRKKAILDMLLCWPIDKDSSNNLSLHYDFAKYLFGCPDKKDSLVLVKLFLRKPMLDEYELSCLSLEVQSDSLIMMLWIIVMTKEKSAIDNLPNLLIKHKQSVESLEIDNELMKEILDCNTFIKLIPTPMYTAVLNFILCNEMTKHNRYTLQWAIEELVKAGYLAEAGHLKLMAMRVPTQLRGFTQAVMSFKDLIFNKE